MSQLMVYKYEIFVGGPDTRIEMPPGAKLLKAGDQDGDPSTIQLWAEVIPQGHPVERTFRVVGTGHSPWGQPPVEERLEYVDTVLTLEGQLVWHLYEVKR